MREDILKSENLEQAIWLALFSAHSILTECLDETEEADRMQEIVTSLRAYVKANPA